MTTWKSRRYWPTLPRSQLSFQESKTFGYSLGGRSLRHWTTPVDTLDDFFRRRVGASSSGIHAWVAFEVLKACQHPLEQKIYESDVQMLKLMQP